MNRVVLMPMLGQKGQGVTLKERVRVVGLVYYVNSGHVEPGQIVATCRAALPAI